MTGWPTVMAALAAWPGEFTDAKRAGYAAVLDDENPDAVLAAVKRLAKRGGSHRPSPSEISGEIRSDPTRPTFDEVLAQLVRAVQVRPDAAVLERGAGWMHPYALAFLKSFGVDRFRRLEIYDDDYGDLRTRELRDAWMRFETVAETRERHGLELAPGRNGTLRQLEPHETLRQLAPPGHIDHHRPAERPTRGTT